MPDLPAPKLFATLDAAVSAREQLRAEGRCVVMTNGCFDLLHPGHLAFLRTARELGDYLLIALNGDASVAALKGPARPVQTARERAYTLDALSFVDGIVIFDTPRLTAEITALKPDLYAKAGDYTLDSLDPGERTALQAVGAEIRFLPFLEGYSTTRLIARIAKAADTF